MSEETLLRIVILVIGGLGSAGGLVAWQRFRGEKRSGQLIIKAAEGAVVIQGGVLDTLNNQLAAQDSRMGLLEMEIVEKDKRHEDCQEALAELKVTVGIMQHDLASHSRMSELSRRKTHVAINALGNYELLIETIFSDMRRQNAKIDDSLRPIHIRENFQRKMNELEDLEARVTQQAVNTELRQEERADAALRDSQQDKGQSNL